MTMQRFPSRIHEDQHLLRSRKIGIRSLIKKKASLEEVFLRAVDVEEGGDA